ncbi:MAG: hypothetical protein HC875_25100 [Anaerolineales bacterium]|nr:hypothetical protein [Anaerolineales bacterium]
MDLSRITYHVSRDLTLLLIKTLLRYSPPPILARAMRARTMISLSPLAEASWLACW